MPAAHAQTAKPPATAAGQTANTPSPDRRIGGASATAPCVEVDIAGYRAGHLDCASRQLQSAAKAAQASARAGFDAPVIDARSADVRTGIASQTATRQRMGNMFGVSVHPQRPDVVPRPSRPGGTP